MRVAAVFDVHGNLPALDAVLADVDRVGVDVIVSGGDLVAGPFATDVFDALARRGDVLYVRGNGDREVVEHGAGHHAAAALGSERLAAVAAWPLTVTVDVDALGAVLFCHATPRGDSEIVTTLSPDDAIAAAFAGVDGVVVVGHTHTQFDRRVGSVRVINAGSVGMPYEGARGAFWALLGPAVELRRTDYDVDAAAAAIEVSGAPDFAAVLLDPPDAVEATRELEARRGP